jgi:biopolymer transport protein ExbD
MSTQDQDFDGTVTGINVTPLVDIMLVLLIVFMVTAHFVSDSSLNIQLPKAAATEASVMESLTVSLNEKGNIFLMEKAVDMNALKTNLAQEVKQNPAIRVTLAADGRLPYNQVVEVLDAVKQAGVVKVALAAEK